MPLTGERHNKDVMSLDRARFFNSNAGSSQFFTLAQNMVSPFGEAVERFYRKRSIQVLEDSGTPLTRREVRTSEESWGITSTLPDDLPITYEFAINSLPLRLQVIP